MKYLKKFETHADYETYKNSQDYLTPNVSYCVEQTEVHYEKSTPPPPETRLVYKLNVNDTSTSTNLVFYDSRAGRYLTNNFSDMEIDGVLLERVTGVYQFDTTGEHTIKCTLIDDTVIGNMVFNQCSGITSVTIPDSVTSLSASVFNACTGLTSITIPDSVTSLGSFAFSGCSGITSVTIPDSVTSIGDNAFLDCTGLTSVTLSDSITSIGGQTFDNCTSLTSITIPDSVTSIGNSAFNGCTSLTSITIPDSVTSIGNSAFNGCTNITSIVVGSGVTELTSFTFQNCSSLISIIFNAVTPPTLSESDDSVFRNTNNCTFYVPSESVSAYKSATGWRLYESRIEAIPGR